MIIRICTENKNHERVRELCAKRFDAFTIYYGMGAWNGQTESSLTIDIAVLDRDPNIMSVQREKHHALMLAGEIKKLNQQEAVLIEYIESTNTLI